MNLAYNMDFEIASLFFVAILLIYMMIQYPKSSGQTSIFKWIAFTLILTEALDIISVILNANINIIPKWICILSNTLYFMIGTILPFLMLQYISKYIIPKDGKAYLLNFSAFFLIISEASYIINISGKYYYYFDENGIYQHGPLYALVYTIPIALVSLAGLNIVLNRKFLAKKQLFSTLSYVLLILVGGLSQAFFFPNVTLFLYTSALGILILFFSLETPDYFLLNKTLNELQESKKEAEELYEKAREANNAKSDFLANMSHEIRTPINAIIGLNEMILRESKDEEILGYASDAKGAINTLYSLVNEILDFSKIESGKLDIIPVPYYFESIMFDIKNIIYELCSKKNLELIFEIDPNIPSKMLGDEIRIKQILINLLTNAVKYTKTGYIKLSVSAKYTNERVALTCIVEDTGIGINNDELEKLFKPFERLDQIKNRNIEGTGLGLSITRQLLANMGSELIIESEYGKGSTFSFTLEQNILVFSPVGHKDWLSRQFEAVTPVKSELLAPDAKILLVDDNDLNRKVFVSLLKETKIQIDEAVDGIECLEKLKTNNYDIIYLDHMMPRMDGMETLRHIKNEHICDDTPIIVLTANAIAGMKEQYLREGFSDFLPKPVFSQSLENSISKWLSPSLMIEKNISEDNIDYTDEHDSDTTEISLPEIDGILWDYGKLFLPLNILLRTAIDYYEALANTITQINTLYADIHLPNGILQYQTCVHSLKSTSAMIGATQVSALAKILEKAAKNNDMKTIDSLTPVLLHEMQILQTNMSVLETYNVTENVTPVKDIKSIASQLAGLRDALNEYDYDTADTIMSRISESSYTDATAEIEELKQQVINLQSMPAIETIEKILSYINK